MKPNELSASEKWMIEELVDLFATKQPTGLIADEIMRSSSIVRLASRRGPLYRALRSAEQSFGREEFWTSPPGEIANLVQRTRAAFERASSPEQRRQILIDLVVEDQPQFLN